MAEGGNDTLRCLVVEDIDNISTSICEVLRGLGINSTEVAENYEAAREKLIELLNGGEDLIVVLDGSFPENASSKMPKFYGNYLIQGLEEELKGTSIKVLFLLNSGSYDDNLILSATLADGYYDNNNITYKISSKDSGLLSTAVEGFMDQSRTI